MNLNAILVEDEFKIREVLTKLLNKHCSNVNILAEANNVNTAYELITKLNPDVIFLDIEMPGGNGFDLLSKFETINFEIIFVTSYDHYAINAIKFSALDYLLKPVIVEELKQAVSKAVEKVENKHFFRSYNLLRENLESKTPCKLGIVNKGKLYHISIGDIIYLEGDGNYSNIYMINGEKFVTAKTLKEYEEMLCNSEGTFIRVHKSYIANINQIDYIEKGKDLAVLRNNTTIEISRRKRQELLNRLSA